MCTCKWIHSGKKCDHFDKKQENLTTFGCFDVLPEDLKKNIHAHILSKLQHKSNASYTNMTTICALILTFLSILRGTWTTDIQKGAGKNGQLVKQKHNCYLQDVDNTSCR
jgi:hypothetical protein